MNQNQPIGVFDSGLGGLTVLRALREQLPAEDFLYIGDTARLPYGAKSRASITQFTKEAVSALIDRGCKLVVVACNTATAAALPAVQAAFPHIPVIGTIESGAASVACASRSGIVAVIATAATVCSGAYEQAIQKALPASRVRSIACPLFVTLAEEGWMGGSIVEAIAQRYLGPVFSEKSEDRPDCLVLGCTHFPPLRQAIAQSLPPEVAVVDPALATALEVKSTLAAQKLARLDEHKGVSVFQATDAPERFAAVGSLFLQCPMSPEEVHLITLG